MRCEPARVNPRCAATPLSARRIISNSLLHRPVALDGDPVAGAGVRPIIPHRVVLAGAVVPEGDRVLPPAEPALVFRDRRGLRWRRIVLDLRSDADDAPGEGGLTYSPFLPVSGWVRTTGCSARG